MILALTLFALSAQAQQWQTYEGTAVNDKGEVQYTEKHRALFDKDQRILEAKTQYFSAEGKLLGTMSSSFREKVSAPAYTYLDHRDGSKHGIRHDKGKVILFTQDKGQPEKTKLIESDETRLPVGCQGLHYYLRDRLEQAKQKVNLPLQFLIPGKLDYYSFELKYTESQGQVMKFDIEISNFFLKLFAPKLVVHYDTKTKRLVHYEGLSNITDENGDLQNVTIKYNYSPMSPKSS